MWFFATETGQEFVDAFEPTIIHSWDHLLDNCAWIEENKPTKFGDGRPIRTIAFDTVDLLFRMCMDYVSNQLGVEDPSELEHGKGWARLNAEFTRVMNKIGRWPFSLVFISHERDRQFKTRATTTNRREPDLGVGGVRVLNAMADLILWCHTDQRAEVNDNGEVTGKILEERLAQCHPTSGALAGGRMSHLLPEKIELSYEALTKAFREGVQRAQEEK